jgi:addiction module HigA family antidote
MAKKPKTQKSKPAKRKPAKVKIPAKTQAKIPARTEAKPPARSQSRIAAAARVQARPPARVHPGEILRKKFMEPLALTANALALALRVPATRIGDLLNGRRAISADTALRLGRYFGTPARFWLDLQIGHDLAVAAAERGAVIARDVYPRAA